MMYLFIIAAERHVAMLPCRRDAAQSHEPLPLRGRVVILKIQAADDARLPRLLCARFDAAIFAYAQYAPLRSHVAEAFACAVCYTA